MGSELDLDDVAATSERAKRELAELRDWHAEAVDEWGQCVDEVKRQDRQIEELRAEVARLREALGKIENFGHGIDHYGGIECADMAAAALAPNPPATPDSEETEDD